MRAVFRWLQWLGDYDKLERYHGYIQWLFPIREHGMNQVCRYMSVHLHLLFPSIVAFADIYFTSAGTLLFNDLFL